MINEPIIIVAGEPNSIFLEIFFKCIKTQKYKSPLILIASKKLLEQQMKKLGFFFEINTIDKNFTEFKKLDNAKINLINIEYKFKNCYGCLYSDYSPYGVGFFGSMLCFKEQKSNYLKVSNNFSKKDFFDLMEKGCHNVPETFCCNDFNIRKRGTGYRG